MQIVAFKSLLSRSYGCVGANIAVIFVEIVSE